MKAERGSIHIIIPGVVESHAPLSTVEEIELAISVLILCRDIAKRKESDIPCQIRIFQDSDLMAIGGDAP